MGDFLTKPITEKNATDGKDARLMYGACSMQGWRKSNEDAHIHTLDLGDGNSLFAVFDGHGGEQVARFCEKHFPEILLASEEYQAKNYERALEESFVETDFMLVSDEGYDKLQEVVLELKREARGAGAKLEMSDLRDLKSIPFAAGCTANVCLVTQDSIYCANAGDSRSILVSKSGKVTELSQDHKPDDPGEFKRIKAGGGFVEDGRVQGIIAVSRAIGDWEYKNPALLQQLESKKPLRKKSTKKAMPEASPMPKSVGPYRQIDEAKKHQVSSYPDIKKIPIKSDLDFICCACDGIWDCYSNEEAAKYIRNKRSKGPKHGVLSKSMKGKATTAPGLGSSPLKVSKSKSESSKKNKVKGDTSFIIEEMMDNGIAKGDITMSDGTGTDNMTCVIVQFRDPEDVANDNDEKEEFKSTH